MAAIGAASPAAAARGGAAMIVSTWDFGAAANDAAFAAMKAGGTLLDAVEAGAKVPEADPNNHSVGYSGYPDRDGHVTLDAVIMDDAGGVGAVAAVPRDERRLAGRAQRPDQARRVGLDRLGDEHQHEHGRHGEGAGERCSREGMRGRH